VHSARRAEEKEALKARLKVKPEHTIASSNYTLATFRGVDKEYIQEENPMVEEFKSHEKKKIIEKFLNNDEIFFKIMNMISPTLQQIESARASHTTQTRTHQEVMSENRRFTDLNSETMSPRSTTNNTNINFYIQTTAGLSSER
jgi:hypothetical protein